MEIQNFLLGILIIFTLISLFSLGLIFRQVSHSQWIDSRALPFFWVMFVIVIVLLIALWVSYLFYIKVW